MKDGALSEKVKTTRPGLLRTTALLALLFTSAVAPDALAYCRTTTCQPEIDCIYDDDGCATVGVPLFWPTRCVSFTVHKGGSISRGISAKTTSLLARKAFRRWLNTDCDGDPVALQAAYFGLSSCGEPEYNQTSPNANVILFRDTDWPYDNTFSTLAFTEVTFNTETGELYDADIEINSFAVRFTTGDDDVEVDLDSILTHEVGHFLGLDHTQNLQATMSPVYENGDKSARTLSDDDIAGICEIYPLGRETTANDCIPRHGFSRLCEANASKGCGVSRGAPPASGAWVGLFALTLLRPLGRRRRHARATRG